MIQINNLVKKFDDFTALDGVNMNVEKGAVYGLVGPNGAGKSTLIRHITGVMRQDAGKCLLMVSLYMKMQGLKDIWLTFRMICFIFCNLIQLI